MLDNYGKVEYYIISCPDEECEYSYSAKKLQEDLNSIVKNQKLQGVFIPLDRYPESMYDSVNVIDMSLFGARSLLIFENNVIELLIRAEGMIEYRSFSKCNLEMKKINDYLPENFDLSDDYIYDISNFDITYQYTNQTVKNVIVRETNEWSFPLSKYDEALAEIAAENYDLPEEIDFILDNGVQIRFVGDYIEYYSISIEKREEGLL